MFAGFSWKKLHENGLFWHGASIVAIDYAKDFKARLCMRIWQMIITIPRLISTSISHSFAQLS